MSLDRIYQCDPVELMAFTSAGRFGYFRHVLRGEDYDVENCWLLTSGKHPQVIKLQVIPVGRHWQFKN